MRADDKKQFIVAVTLAVCLATGCSSLNRSVHKMARGLIVEHNEVKAPPKEAPESFKRGMVALERGQFEEALSLFESSLAEQPTTPWTQATRLNIGRSLEGLERWTEAAEQYRSVIAATQNAPKLQAMALYRLSFCHEAVGNDQDAVATLNDLLSRERYLPKEVGGAEVPARLATAYARVGNFDRATLFYKQAEAGIARLRKESDPKDLPEWLPRTLFYMGMRSSQDTSWEGFDSVIRPFARGQVYLLQAAEVGASPWSDRAAEELMLTYSQLWRSIEAAPAPTVSDPVVAQRAVQQMQWERVSLLLEILNELKARTMPSEVETASPQAKKVFNHINDVEARALALLRERPAGEGLTAEAKSRRGGVRARVVTPDDSLERRFIRDSKNVPEIDVNKKDPNL